MIMIEKDLSIQPEEPSFYEFYAEKLTPFLGVVEEKRQQFLKIHNYSMATCVLIMLLIFISKNLFLQGFALTMTIMISSGLRFTYSQEAKKLVLDQILKFFGDFTRSKKKVSISKIESLDCFESFDCIDQKDRFIGRYKKLNVQLAQLKLIEKKGSGKNSSTKTVFRGLLLQVDMTKKFKGKTIICKDQGIFNGLQGKSMPRVSLEDATFEKFFEVYSTDQIEARYLLTLTFMERLKSLNLSHGGGIRAAFVDQKIFLVLPYAKDLFEVNLFKDAYDISQYRAILRDLQESLAVVDTLKLDQNIGL